MSDEVLSQEEIEALISETEGGSGGGEPQDAAPEAGGEPGGEGEPEADASAVPEIRVQTPADTVVRPVEFAPVSGAMGVGSRGGMDLIMDVQLQVTVELGRTTLKVRDVLGLGPGAVVELDKHAGEPVDVVVNNKPVARGEVVVIDENFGVRVTEIIDKDQRDARAKAA